MSRLLFAAARGARIQYDWYGRWMDTGLAPLEEVERAHRIHPDDLELQYGPISTALLDIAAEDFAVHEVNRRHYTDAAYAIADAWEAGWQPRYSDSLHRSLFLLILAEALADEGL